MTAPMSEHEQKAREWLEKWPRHAPATGGVTPMQVASLAALLASTEAEARMDKKAAVINDYLANFNLDSASFSERLNELEALRGRVAELERERDEADGEFNAGYECAEKGGAPSDEPNEIEHDEWLCGFAWFHWTHGDGKYTGRNKWPPIFGAVASEVAKRAFVTVERDSARALNARLREALLKLRNEAKASLVFVQEAGGNTNARVLGLRIIEADAVLAESESASEWTREVERRALACHCGQPRAETCCEIGCGDCPACDEHNRRMQVRDDIARAGEGGARE